MRQDKTMRGGDEDPILQPRPIAIPRWVRSGLASLKFYDPNPTRPAIKKIFVTQPNPPSPKNQPNPPGRFWRVGCTSLQIKVFQIWPITYTFSDIVYVHIYWKFTNQCIVWKVRVNYKHCLNRNRPKWLETVGFGGISVLVGFGRVSVFQRQGHWESHKKNKKTKSN